MGCLCCGGGREVGVLCRACMLPVAPCEGLIPEHVRANAGATAAAAWVVDGFGVAHPISIKTTMGRAPEGGLVVLATSVSRDHAELRRTDAGWHVRDLGSRNGTFVDGTRVQGRVGLPARTLLKLGDVALWVLTEVSHQPSTPPSMATGSIAGGVLRFVTNHNGFELCLVGSTDPAAGGALLTRSSGTEAWTERGLAPLEFQLLRTLCLRAIEEARSPSAVRGCVATKQLARDLPFQSKYANEENVRQVVRRLRTALAEFGADGLLAVAPGRGYYLASPVTIAASDRR